MIESPYYLSDQYSDDAPKQTIHEKLCDGTILIGYGKPGHGMNGKDADLDRVGQCLVKKLITEDPIGAENMRVAIHLRLYATICAPCYENVDYYMEKMSAETKEALSEFINCEDEEVFLEYLRDQACEIVIGMGPVGDFMYDDDNAWTGGTDAVLYVDLTVDEYYEIEDGNEETLAKIANRINDEIYEANKGGYEGRDIVKRFEEEVGLANDMINDLP